MSNTTKSQYLQSLVNALEKEGYLITKPIVNSGKIIVYKYLPNGKYFAYDEDSWQDYKDKVDRTAVAYIDWAEGIGMEEYKEKYNV